MQAIERTMALLACVLAAACSKSDDCSEVTDYFFAPRVDEVRVDAGSSGELSLIYYPTPPKRLSYFAELENQIYLTARSDVLEGRKFSVIGRQGKIVRRQVGSDSPIEFNIPVTASRDGDRGFVFEFGPLGRVMSDDYAAMIVANFHLSSQCLLDSQDGYRSDELRVTVVE